MRDYTQEYQQFIHSVFPQSELQGDDTVVVCPSKFGAEDAYSDGVTGRLKLGQQPVYVMVSTAGPRNSEGKLRRRQVDCREAWLFVLDDIGTKSGKPGVEPSYKLRTSWKPNADGELVVSNEQWGYLLTPFDVSTPEGARYYDACTVAAGRAGISDEGMRGPQRICRVPGSLHNSGYVAELIEGNFDRVFELPELAAALGLDVQSVLDGKDRRVLTDGVASLGEVQDSVADWLLDTGRASGAIRSDWMEIECPWAADHTDGRVEAGYSPLDYGRVGRQFRCLHGHCADKNTGLFLRWVAEQGGPVAEAVPPQKPRPGVGDKLREVFGLLAVPDALQSEMDDAAEFEDFLDDLVYLENQGKWVQQSKGAAVQYSADGLQMVFGHLMPPSGKGPGKRARVADMWAAREAKAIVYDTACLFDKPYGFVDDSGRAVFNVYRKFVPRAAFDVAVANRWNDHVLSTFGSEGRWLIQWMGWVAQHPEQRVKWAPVLIGVQGDGKSILGVAMQTVIEAQRWVVTSTSSVMSERNSYVDGAMLVVIEEIRMSGVNRHAAMDKLKDLVTNDHIELRVVYQKPKTVRNFANLIAMTNHWDAMPVGEGDRRFAVFGSVFHTRQQMLTSRGPQSGYFDALWDDIRNTPEKVAGWLMNVDLSGFDPHAPAPWTAAKTEMADEARGEMSMALQDLLERDDVPYVSDAVFFSESVAMRLKIDSLKNAGLVKDLREWGWVPTPPFRVGERVSRGWYKPSRFPQKGDGLGAQLSSYLVTHNAKLGV